MKQSIGLTVTINIIIVFIMVAFVFVAGILSYSKAFKAASVIVKQLERFEGYNVASIGAINTNLSSLSYQMGDSSKCKETRHATIGEGNLVLINDINNSYTEEFEYCIYKFENDVDNKHYSYGVVTYITIDFYMFNMKLRIPVYAKTNRIYRFTNT